MPTALSTSVNSAYEVPVLIRTQKHTEEKGTNGGQGPLVERSLINASENEFHDDGHHYDNEDLFRTIPNTAYGTVGKTNMSGIIIICNL